MKSPDEVEAGNLMEEVVELVSPCINCGLCKSNSAEFLATRKEHVSPRGKIALLREKILDENIFEDALSGSCERICPVKVRYTQAILKARQAWVLLGKEIPKKEEQDVSET